MRATAEFLTEIVSNAADVCAFGTSHAKVSERLRVTAEYEIVNMDQAWLTFDFEAFTREFVERHAFHLHRRYHRRRLQLVANELCCGAVQLLKSEWRHGIGGDDLAIRIVAIRGFAELDGARIRLVIGHEFLGQFGTAPQQNHQQAGSIRVERTGMADFLEAE